MVGNFILLGTSGERHVLQDICFAVEAAELVDPSNAECEMHTLEPAGNLCRERRSVAINRATSPERRHREDLSLQLFTTRMNKQDPTPAAVPLCPRCRTDMVPAVRGPKHSAVIGTQPSRLVQLAVWRCESCGIERPRFDEPETAPSQIPPVRR